MQPFLALITPLTGSGAHPDNTLPRPPGVPTHPIYNPAYPDNTLPRPPGVPTHPIYNPAYPDQGLPGHQPYPDQGLPRPPGVPTHPIYNPAYPDQGLPQPPLGTWGGVAPPWMDNTLPGHQPYPDQGLPRPPGVPSHPIYFPPEISGPNDPRPTPPIALPPDLPDVLPDERPVDWKVGWTAATGWIVVGIPQFPVPTPS